MIHFTSRSLLEVRSGRGLAEFFRRSPFGLLPPACGVDAAGACQESAWTRSLQLSPRLSPSRRRFGAVACSARDVLWQQESDVGKQRGDGSPL